MMGCATGVTMAKKTTTTNRPYVKTLTSNLKSPDGKSRTIELGPKTLIIGPNGSGKSAIQQSLQLALIGSADDLLGRMNVRDAGMLMSMVSAERLAINGKLSSGGDFTFLAKDGGRPTHDAGEVAMLPLHQVREVLEGSPATARKAFLSWAAAGVSPGDVADLVPAIYRSKYRDISEAVGRGRNAVDSLLAVLEYVGKRQRDASKEATGAEALLSGMAEDLEACPTEEMITAANEANKKLQTLLVSSRSLINRYDSLKARCAELQAKLAQPVAEPVDPVAQEFYKSMAYAASVTVDNGLSACPLCSSNVGRDHLVACRNHYNLTVQSAPAAPSFNRALAAAGLRETLEGLEAIGPLPDIDQIGRAATAAQEEYLRLRNLTDRWNNLSRARDTAAEMAVESETYKAMKKELEGVVGSLLKQVVDVFVGRVQAFLPRGWKFAMQLTDATGRDVFRLGLASGSKLRAALSGAEWATVTCAIAMAIATDAKPEQPVLVMPEDRGWDAVTLAQVISAWSNFDGQVVIGTTTKPKTVPPGWTVVDMGKEPQVEEPEPVKEKEPEVRVEVIQQPLSPMMRQMLMALGYPDAALGGITPEQALDIVSNGRAYHGGE